MELNEFIRSVLVGISQGVIDSQEEVVKNNTNAQ